MRKCHPLVIALPTFVLSCLTTASLTGVAHAAPIAPVVRWQYKVVLENDLNRLGQAGWEYCGESAATTDAGYHVDRQYTLRKRL